ncbi:MAG: putative nuclease, RNAse H fold [Candidatus Methanohalarchaeum thermophilum]|uniref:Nuclease, RNAse H fold n=1 Tax=Methanohalarchaeum thermophilum TaxID=1903181 RepID=A0A1Q6DWI0_METT1|nr:MAG: putative nuclease, RNAse H fold [Candidatus Methanohalarchaeum thermophilum]
MFGIDGTRKGWIVANYRDQVLNIKFIDQVSELDIKRALIDMPIGLPEQEIRESDKKARKILSPYRHYSIFNTPIRKAVYAEDYEQACRIQEEKTGKRISKQTWNIVPKIREVDQFLSQNKLIKLHESHPEIIFKQLGGNKVIKPSKHTKKGLKKRIQTITKNTILKEKEIQKAIRKTQGKKDDIIDAIVLSIAGKYELTSIGKGKDQKKQQKRHKNTKKTNK